MALSKEDGSPVASNATISTPVADRLVTVTDNIYEETTLTEVTGVPQGSGDYSTRRLVLSKGQQMKQSQVNAVLARA